MDIVNTETLRHLAFQLPPNEQYRLAVFLAENIGYVLIREADHPDCPHGTPAPADGEAHAEIQRLRDAKRRALAIADERAKENVALREQAFKTAEILETSGIELDVPYRSFLARQLRAALSSAPPASEGARENLGSPEWDRAVKAAATAPEPADTLDEGPDPLGYAKGERA